MAFTALFFFFFSFGLDNVLKRELVNNSKKSNIFLGTVFRLRFFLSLVVGFFIVFFVIIIRPQEPIILFMTMFFVLGNILDSFSGISKYFASRIESEKVVKSSSIALILSNILKIFFILFNFSVIWFAISSFINGFIRNIFQIIYYLRNGESLNNWRFDFKLAKKLLSKSWPLMFSAVFAILYLRIDQIMIGLMLGDYELGIYSVAVKISEIGFFLPSIIAGSLFPAILASRKKSKKLYFHRLQKMFDVFTWVPLVVIIPVFLFSNFIIVFLYGVEFASAGIVLAILIWALLAIFIRAGVDNYIVFEELYKIKLYYSLMGAIVNIVANIMLIPIYGIVGAAIATIISYFFVAYISNLFFKETRKIFWMQIKAFNLFRVFKENRF
ncbi:MAG: flippase [Candidatus Woesearchaeota archaeon]